MKRIALAVGVLAALPFAACHGKKPVVKAPSGPDTTATETTVPPAPPIAPTTESRDVNIVPGDDIRAWSLEDINQKFIPSKCPDVHFDLDRAEIKDTEKPILSTCADNLKRQDFLKLTLEGHADERGTAEYNLALSERRARAVYDYLVSLGVAAARLKTVGYGKEIPVCTQPSEDCHAQNRRGHFAATGK